MNPHQWFLPGKPLISRLFRKSGTIFGKAPAPEGDMTTVRSPASKLDLPGGTGPASTGRAFSGHPESDRDEYSAGEIERDCPALSRPSRKEGSFPPDETEKALRSFLAGNINDYLDLDPKEGHPLLARAYLASPWSMRARILTEVRRIGRPELLIGLLSNGNAATVLPSDFFQILARRLAATGDWDAVETVLFRAPLPAAHTAACLMKESGLLPLPGDSRYWRELEAAIPGSFRIPVPGEIPSASHSGFTIRAARMVLDGKGRYLATGFPDGTIEVWQIPGGGLLCRQSIGREAISCLAFHHSGATLACGGSRGTVLVMEIPTGEVKLNRLLPERKVTALGFSRDDPVLYAGGEEGSLVELDLRSGRHIAIPALTRSEVTIIVAGSCGTLWSGHCNGEVRRHDTAGHAVPLKTNSLGKPVTQITIGPKDNFVAAAASGGPCRVWDGASGSLIATLEGNFGSASSATAIAPGLDWYATGHVDGSIRLFSLPDGHEHTRFRAHREGVSTLCFSHDGTKLIAGSRSGMIHILPVSSPGAPVFVRGNKGMVRDIAASGRLFAARGWNGNIEIRDATDGSLLQGIGVRSGANPRIAHAPAAGLIAISGDNGQIHLWAGRDRNFTGTLESYLPGITALALTPDGRSAVVAGKSGAVEVIGIPGGEIRRRLSGHTGAIHALACDGAGTLCAAGGWDASVHLFSLPGGERTQVLSGHKSPVTSLSFIPQHGMIVSTSQDRTARLWDLDTGHQCGILAGHTHIASCSAVSPDGSLLATGSFDTSILLWSLPDGGLVGRLKGDSDRVTSLVFAGDRMLASGDRAGNIGLWMLPGNDLIRVVRSGSGNVTGLVPGPGGTGLISSHEQGACHCWALPFTKTAATATPDDLLQVRGFRGEAERSGDVSAAAWGFIEMLLTGSLRSAIALSETPPLSGGYEISIAED